MPPLGAELGQGGHVLTLGSFTSTILQTRWGEDSDAETTRTNLKTMMQKLGQEINDTKESIQQLLVQPPQLDGLHGWTAERLAGWLSSELQLADVAEAALREGQTTHVSLASVDGD
jgi:hypothetical protein